MNLLVDTAPFLWLCAGGGNLSPTARAALASWENSIFVSAVTGWEIALKCAKGKLILPAPVGVWFPAMIAHHGCELLAIDAPAAIASTQLARIHADPFDRLLVATALARGLILITSDPKIQQYPSLQTLW